MLIEPGSKLVMIGDSITDFDRARPVGEGLRDALGKSYVMLVDAMLKAIAPQDRIRVVNMGTSGDTTRDLLARWRTDLLDLKPDWVTILIGINDVWRQFDTPLLTENQVPPEEYQENLRRLVESTLPAVKGMVLLSPYFMEPNREDPMRRRMDEYGGIMARIAQEYQLPFVDLQAEFDRYFQYYHPVSVNWDRIHPDMVGHMLIARAFLKTIGFSMA